MLQSSEVPAKTRLSLTLFRLITDTIQVIHLRQIFLFTATLLLVEHGFAYQLCPAVVVDSCHDQPAHIQAAIAACEMEVKTNQCEKVAKLLPKESLRDCRKFYTCHHAARAASWRVRCSKAMVESLGDQFSGLWQLVLSFGQAVVSPARMTPEMLARQAQLEECTTVDCKEKLLGPHRHLFRQEEIEGNIAACRARNLHPDDPANKTYCRGMSAAVLYRQLLLRVRQRQLAGENDPPVIEPWSGREAKLLKTDSEIKDNINAAVEAVLVKAGVTHRACIDPMVLNEMECYAFFSIIDPISAGVAVGKVARLAGAVSDTSKSLVARSQASALAQHSLEKATNELPTPKESVAQRLALVKESNRQGFINQWLRYTPTNEIQNKTHRNLVFSGEFEELVRQGRAVTIDIENSVLKTLNTNLKDEPRVTAMTNLHKAMTLENISALLKRHPNIKLPAAPEGHVAHYSDFKSQRLAFVSDQRLPTEFINDLKKTIEKTNAEFATVIRERGLVRLQPSDETGMTKSTELRAQPGVTDPDPVTWFKAGIGDVERAADMANLTSRYARSVSSPNRVFTASEIKADLQMTLSEIEGVRRTLQTRNDIKGTELLQKLPDRDSEFVLSEAAHDLLKKYPDNQEFRLAAEGRIGVTGLTEGSIQAMREYKSMSNEFSPPLYIMKREFLSLNNRHVQANGGVLLDFLGLDASNQVRTQQALAAANGNISTAVHLSRQGEIAVTEAMNTRVVALETIHSSGLGRDAIRTQRSGDDIPGSFTRSMSDKDIQTLVNKYTQVSDRPIVRAAILPRNVTDPNLLNTFGNHGHAIETKLRKLLESAPNSTDLRSAQNNLNQQLRKTVIAIDMRAAKETDGRSVKFLISNADKLTKAERQLLEERFRKAIEQVNDDLKSEIGNFTPYRPGGLLEVKPTR